MKNLVEDGIVVNMDANISRRRKKYYKAGLAK
jgi:hypothetical protein